MTTALVHPGLAPRVRPAGGAAGRAAREPTRAQRHAIDRLLAWAERQRSERAARPDAQLEHDAHGDLTRIVEADGRSRRFAYDAQRRLVEAEDDTGRTRWHYDAADRLVAVEGPAVVRRHVFDAAGRLVEVRREAADGAAAGSGALAGIKYRYDDAGRAVEYRHAAIACGQRFDAAGRVDAVWQAIDGVELRAELAFDAAGRLATLALPGHRIGYEWDPQGRLAAVTLDGAALARWRVGNGAGNTSAPNSADASGRATQAAGTGATEYLETAGGVQQRTRVDPVDGRPLERTIGAPGADPIEHRRWRYDDAARVLDDGLASYTYDAQGRLAGETRAGRAPVACVDGHRAVADVGDEREFLFDALGELAEVRHRGRTLARFEYDAKGRLTVMQAGERSERYLYGPADELLAVTDRAGRLRRACVPTPSGCLAEIVGGVPRFLHLDRRGACTVATGAAGEPIARFGLDAYGLPDRAEVDADPDAPQPWFGGRRWVPEVGLYRFGARWYDPRSGRFLTPDSHTAAPDDERLVHPLLTGAAQVALRRQLLPNWLRHPAARDRHAFCAHDPVNRVDPNGHWSFGGVVLSLLGAIWTLPNTLFGLLIEITCLVGEVVRWLAWLFSGGNLTWATPGFDVASSSHLNAFALVFRGGWLGSFSSLLGITFGNVFFVYDEWENVEALKGEGTVKPPAYGGTVEIPKHDALYEHELRHTNQYGWLGPFFHLGMPLFGFYEWDVIFHGYEDAILETDAREHGGF